MTVSSDNNTTNPASGETDYNYLTPEELLSSFCQGDAVAFEELVKSLESKLFGFIYKYIQEQSLAEDVYQNVLLKIALNAQKYDGRARLNTWVFKIARNCAIDALRKRNRNREIPASAGVNDGQDNSLTVEDVISKEFSPEESITVAELGERITQAVSCLPQEQREVFLLREDADLSFDEIAQLLECNKETVKSRMRYAINKLREALKADARLYGLLAGL